MKFISKFMFIFIVIAIFTLASCGSDDKTTDPTNNCKPNPCQNEGVCNDGSCECIAGFEGDNCETKIEKHFITTWKTDNQGSSTNIQITIPTADDSSYNYDVDCENDGVFEATGITASHTCEYNQAGTYTIAIKGDFPKIYFNFEGDREKILSIDQWGTNAWLSMEAAFSGCSNLTILATDSPNLSQLTNASYMLAGTSSLNQDISKWDTSNIKDMSYMFFNSASFNQDISAWNVSAVTNMHALFWNAKSFNQDISNWDVENVNNMDGMFLSAESFNQDISAWNVSIVTNMNGMFSGAKTFNQDISTWKVSAVNDMGLMFRGAEAFNQDLSSWDVDQVEDCSDFASDATNWTLAKPNFTSCTP